MIGAIDTYTIPYMLPIQNTIEEFNVDWKLILAHVSSSNGGVQSHSAPKYTTYRPNLA